LFSKSTQARAVLDSAGDGSVVLAWDSRRQEGGTYGVFARAFDASGNALSDEIHVNQTLVNMQQRPAVARAVDGTTWFVWESQHQDGSGAGVVARCFVPDAQLGLVPSGDEIAVNAIREGDQAQAVVAVHESGAALAVYANQLAASTQAGSPFELRARRLDVADSADVLVSVPAGASDQLPTLTAHADGFALAWARHHAGDESGIYVQRLDVAGVPQGDAQRVSEIVDAIEPSIASDAAGQLQLAWLAPAPGGYAVKLQGLDSSLAPLHAVKTLAEPDGNWLSGVAVACTTDGRHVVAYNLDRGGDLGEDLVQHRFAANGDLLAVEAASAHAEGRQALNPSTGARRIVWSSQDAIALAWDGDAQLGDSSAVHLSVQWPASQAPHDAVQLAQASQVGASADVDFSSEALAAIPPIFDPNWVPQGRLLRTSAASGDFGFEAVPGTGWTPPDPEMAVGPNSIAVMTNGRIALFDKAGTELWGDEIEDSFGFWGGLGTTGFVFDPEACWDPHDERFLVMACERSSNARSYFLLAVSKDDTPDDANDWHKYRIDVTGIAGNDIDSPNMSVSAGYVLLTADFFSPVDEYLIHIIDKPSIYSGGTPVDSQELISGARQQSMGVPVVYDNTDTLYIVQSTEFSNNTEIILHAVTDPFGSYSRVTHTLTVDNYRYPNQPPQKGSSSRPFLFEPRFWSVAQRNDSIWAVHHVNSTRARVRWYEFELNGWPTSGSVPSERQSGTVNLKGDIHTYFPSIHVDGQDNVAITYARSASNEYISMGRATRSASDPLGEIRPSQVVQVSQNAHTSGRWGDYSGTQADPTQDGVFWGHHEFTDGSSGSWRTWVARYDMRPAPLLLAEDTISSGASHVLSVTGATPGASVFFVYSTLGTELTEVTALNVTMSLEAPTLLGSATANATGDASLTQNVPAGAAGLKVWIQAAENGETSNWYSTTIL